MARYIPHANRGQTLEEIIKLSNAQYRYHRHAVITKIPTEFLPIRNRSGQVVSCKVNGKASVDFIGRVEGTPIAVEAKETNADNIRYDAVQEHQKDFLDDFTNDSDGLGYVLVSFALERFYMVPWRFWRAGRQAWKDAQRRGNRKAEVITACGWNTSGKASMKESELNPEWEVKMHSRVGLDYLRMYG